MYSNQQRNQPQELQIPIGQMASEFLAQELSNLNMSDFNKDIMNYCAPQHGYKFSPELEVDEGRVTRLLKPNIEYFFNFFLVESNNPNSVLFAIQEKEKFVTFIKNIKKLADAHDISHELSHAERKECIDSIQEGAKLLDDVYEHYQGIYEDQYSKLLSLFNTKAVEEEFEESAKKKGAGTLDSIEVLIETREAVSSELNRLAVTISVLGKIEPYISNLVIAAQKGASLPA